LLRAALSAKETEYADALQAMIAALETEGRAQAALKAISGDADAVVVEAEAEATALSTELAAAEDKASEASRALDAAETAKEKAAADANRRADEAAAAAKEVKDAAASAAAAARRMRNAAVLVADARAEETAANEAFRRLETDVEAASVAAVAASVTRSQSTMDKATGSTPESLRKSAAVRRAESEKLAAEAETEEDAKKLAAASKDFKTAATKSRRAKDLRERAAAAASEAEEMEESAAEMATNAAAKEGAGDEAGKEDEKEALNPTEVFRDLNAKLKAAEVESWRARRRRVLAESGLEPEDSPASCALRAAADVLEKRIARREAEIAEDAE
jgi:SWI/SNF-related matrix-associated actin-dependent regulator 1 of chromatin subfamily A